MKKKKEKIKQSKIFQAIKKFTKSPRNSTLSNDIKIESVGSAVLPFYPH